MTKFSLTAFVTIIALTALVGCSRVQPVYNVTADAAPVSGHSVGKVGAIIKKALRDEQWKINQSKPGEIICTIRWRQHSATASIRYTASNYTIKLVKSENLMQKDGVIHHKYNERIKNLQQLIDQRLSGNSVE